MHHSILAATAESVELNKCTACCTLYHCPWCKQFKPARRCKLQKHIHSHMRTALTFEDLRIIRCGLPCRSAGHYHCPWCENTILRADVMKKHLQTANCKQLHSGRPQSPSPAMPIVQSITSPAMPIVQSITSPAMPIVQSTTSPAMPIVQSTTSPVIPIVQSTTSPVIPIVQSTTSPAMPIVQSTTSPVIPIVQSTTSPVIPIVQSTTSPAMPIVQSITSPAMPIVQSITSPAMPIVQSTTSPAMPIVQSTTSPAMPIVQSITSPAMPIVQSTTSPAMPIVQSITSPAMPIVQSTTSPAMQIVQFTTSPVMHSGQSTNPLGQPSSPPQSPSPAMDSSGQVLGSDLPSNSGQAPNPAAEPSSAHSSAANSKIQCPHCSNIMYRKNLRLHIARKHSETCKDITAVSHLAGVCVDASNGISAVQRIAHGYSTPIHVQRKCWGENQNTQCTLDDCLNYLQLAQRSGLPYYVCEHIRSLDYCDRIATEEPLDESILDQMVACQFLGEENKATCLRRQQDALRGGVPFSVLVDLGHSSSRHMCLSICEPEVTYHSKLGRIMVTYNKADNTWRCPCAKPRTSCDHQDIAKWHLFQVSGGELFITTTPPSSPTEQPEEESDSECDAYPPPRDLRRMTEYILSSKKIPFNLPEEVIHKPPTEYPTQLHPAETKCLLCPDQPELEGPVVITINAKIVTMCGIITDVSTFTRRCAVCRMFYRYQEWEHGLHNFNDHILLSLELCRFLRHSVQHHASVSRVINSLEGLEKVAYPPRDAMLHGYCHFEALSDIDYTYSCVACGHHPPVVVITDLHHKKGDFAMAASQIKTPSDDYNGEQNITDFWNSVEMELICRGFVPSRARNPLAVHPNYEHWAPWIGQQTRNSDVVLNTEYEKMSSDKSGAEGLSEDRLVDKLIDQEVGIVRKLCKTCKVDDKGSKIDLIIRLRNEMRTSRQTYDKVFQQICSASGGWSAILCPHGVAYSVKFNLRAERPRDHADLLFSWKHLPNVVIDDDARGLATHANNKRRRPFHPPPFHPNDGILAEPTAENIEAAKKRRLMVSLPWLLNKYTNPDPDAHPVTGSSLHYVLRDNPHERDTNDPYDVLRGAELVPELQGSLSGQVAEQFSGSMRENDYFLSNMAPSTRAFVTRNIVQHRNTEANDKLLKGCLQRGLKLAQINKIH